jgi:tetratricopeptide (TPR) repeat protein
MTGEDDGAVSVLAGKILDGLSVDWAAAETQCAPAEQLLVRRLRAVARIADTHRAGTLDWWGPLRLLTCIGRGAFGDVYRAWDPRLDREVALKLLPTEPSSSGRLDTPIIEEGRLLARVRHPNVVTIHGAERIDDRVGLWMEYIDGRTLHQLVMEDHRRFSPTEVATIGRSICSGVAALHAAGLLHLDIKAQNVMIARDGRVVLMDLGSGRERGRTSGDRLSGTPLYMAPEVILGESGFTVRSDVYSIGVLLFFLLTGTYPVVASDLAALRRAHERGERGALESLISGLPVSLLRAVERAIDPRPERRQESAHALAADLTAATRSGTRASDAAEDLSCPDAHELCVRGNALIERRGMANAQLAVQLFQRAIALDPGCAAAHAGLASAYALWSIPYRGIAFDVARRVIRPSAKTALALDPLLPAAHAAMAWAHAYDREWTRAEQSFTEAIRLGPGVTTSYTSYSLGLLTPQHRVDEALQLLREALRRDAASLNVQREIGEVQLLSGRYEEAVETLRRVDEADPDFPFVQTFLARAYMYSGNVLEALPRLDQGFPWLARVYVMLGRRAEAERMAVEWQAYPFRLCIIAAALGEADIAADALERAASTEPHRIGWLLAQPELRTVRDHTRVAAVRHALGLP